MRRIILASPRGPCAGVRRALEIMERALLTYGKPIYANHEIVHNNHVVDSFRKRGVIFTDHVTDIPENSVYVFSAHGVSPEFRKEAESRKLHIIDATCPLVLKVHREAKKFSETGVKVFFIGHRGHPEVIGTMGVSDMTLIETKKDAEQIHEGEFRTHKVGVITQTTLSVDETHGIMKAMKRKFPHIITPSATDVCYATQNRQNAVKELSRESDLILIIGSESSSNSKRLMETAEREGVRSILIDDGKSIPFDILRGIDTLGITSGASSPEYLVTGIVEELQKKYPDVSIHDLCTVEETMEFSVPKI